MTKLLLALTSFILPVLTSAQDAEVVEIVEVVEVVEIIEVITESVPELTYSLTGGGLFFMIFAWTAIFTWNAVCFTRILADDSKKED